ncbi:MAG: MFS transporter, partial [Candidatus Promineifilaceae bacterium]
MTDNNDLKTFLIIWFGQFVSLVGTGVTRFALLIWAYQQTGEATTLALLGFFVFVPYALISPFAGVLVDRFDRRKVMMATDGAMGVITITLLILFAQGQLAIWHLFIAEFLFGAFDAFQTPAYSAAMSVLIPKKQLGRMNGLMSLGQNASRVVAPFLGGALLPLIQLNGVMWVDVVTFIIAMITLMIVRVPMPPTSDKTASSGSWADSWASVSFGLRFIWQRPGLRGLMILFAAANLLAGITYFGVLPAMVLARSGSDELALATVQAVLGIGGVIGAGLMTVWGGSQRKIDTVLIGMAVSFLVGDLALGIGQSTLVWAVGAFSAQLFIPPLMGAMMAIFQSKIPLDQQGRVL